MHCAGFNSDTYDRYVLGLLEEPDRSLLETQIQEQCPACLTGVQRSMNLWLVFAETLENAEPSEDFRGRIVRIAELSRKVLTFPKNSAVLDRPSVPISVLILICGVTCILLLGTWYASRAWERLDRPNSTQAIDNLSHQLATSNLKIEQMEENERSMKAAGNDAATVTRAAAQRTKAEEDLLSKTQAEAERYRQKAQTLSSLMNMLEKSNARLLPMKFSDTAGKEIGYTILSPKGGLVFAGTNLPDPPKGLTYQFWILRSEEPQQVPAGFMPAEANGTWLMHYDDVTMLSKIQGVEITLEPVEGDYQKPSGPKVMEATVAEDN